MHDSTKNTGVTFFYNVTVVACTGSTSSTTVPGVHHKVIPKIASQRVNGSHWRLVQMYQCTIAQKYNAHKHDGRGMSQRHLAPVLTMNVA